MENYPKGDIRMLNATDLALSFDDGYVGQMRIARLLNKLNVKATFYIITGLKKFKGKPLMALKEDMVHELCEMGHEVGSHTHTHRNLRLLSKKEILYELKKSKVWLENLGIQVHGLAYPYGAYDNRVIAIASEIYDYGRAANLYATEDPWNTIIFNPYVLGALTIHHLPELSWRVCIQSKKPHPIIFAHDVHPIKILLFLKFFKSIGARYVHVIDLLNTTVGNYNPINGRRLKSSIKNLSFSKNSVSTSLLANSKPLSIGVLSSGDNL